MQILQRKTIDMTKNYSLSMLSDLEIHIKKPSIIFLYGDLGAGKTTLSQEIIHRCIPDLEGITSPTYVYYNKYQDIYHFDLYRLKDYDEFISIGGEEILDNNEWIILIEWPELIEKYYDADIKIYLEKDLNDTQRSIRIVYK